MMRWLVHRLLAAAERRTGYDLGYMRAMYAASPLAFTRFQIVAALARHRVAVPLEASEAARIAGTLHEDCGPCTQMVADMAHAKGMADEQIVAVIAGEVAAMSADTALGYRFARAVVSHLSETDALREEVRARWGDRGVLDLTLGTQMSRTYPMIKAGLGFASTCGPIRIGSTSIMPARRGVPDAAS